MKTDLLKYLLWAVTTTPARFACLDDFEAWTAGLGLDPDGCSETWGMVQAVSPAIGTAIRAAA
jgi:hypothetical protein